MNTKEMQFHVEEMRRKDDEIYLLNVECEELETEVGALKRDLAELQQQIDAVNRNDG